jgi:Mg-chelatase subunit ChlD
MTFTTPVALLLLLLIPYFVWLGRPTGYARRTRGWISLALRLFILVLLVFSLAGAQMVRAADELAVVFLVDASDSVGPDHAQAAESFVRRAVESMGLTDRAAVVVFGSNALVERPMSSVAELASFTSVPQALNTDIAEAIRLGLALFPPGSARRLVLVSDGLETTGRAIDAARLAAASGVPIDVVPLPGLVAEDEVWITNVRSPTRVGTGERFLMDIRVESTAVTTAQLRVLTASGLVYDENVRLQPGRNNFSLTLEAGQPGFARYLVEIVPQDDGYYQNNRLAAYTEVTGPPRLLLVSSEGEEGQDEDLALRLALEAAGLILESASPDQLPADLARLSEYAGLAMVNVNAKDLSSRKMAALQSYVRDLGGGLVVVGGPESYGMGGYFRTPLEDILPVEMQIKDQERFPSVSLVLVIDRSGSMSFEEGGLSKIQLAAEGAVRAVELLNDLDEIAIIPVDTRPDQVIGPAPASQREEIAAQVRQLGAGGGGIYVRTGLEAAAQALAASDKQVRHIIILADGADSEQKEGVPELIEELVREGVTVSTVSVGRGADVAWLEEMARLGGGRFHLTTEAANLPQIFTQETTSIQRSYLVEERFFPSLGGSPFARRHPIFQALERAGATTVPPLFGYVATSGKASAQVILETPMGDPLLAVWEYGLGRAVAWTSDAGGRWAGQWVVWDGFPLFWSAVVRWTTSQRGQETLEATVALDGERAQVTVDARDSQGRYLDSLHMQARVVSPSGSPAEITLSQTAPGRYQGAFVPGDEGAYLIRVAGAAADGQQSLAQTAGWVLGYSPEYARFEPDVRLLEDLAAIGDGQTWSLDGDAAQLFRHDLSGRPASLPIWPWLIGLAVVLLPLDVAVRRLVVTRQDLRRAWAALASRLPAAALPVETSEQVARLFEAKDRAAARQLERTSAAGQPLAEAVEPAGQAGVIDTPQRGPRVRPPVRDSETPEPAGSEATLAARLLARRRNRRVNDEEEASQS